MATRDELRRELEKVLERSKKTDENADRLVKRSDEVLKRLKRTS
jgi:hypothetical protein